MKVLLSGFLLIAASVCYPSVNQCAHHVALPSLPIEATRFAPGTAVCYHPRNSVVLSPCQSSDASGSRELRQTLLEEGHPINSALIGVVPKTAKLPSFLYLVTDTKLILQIETREIDLETLYSQTPEPPPPIMPTLPHILMQQERGLCRSHAIYHARMYFGLNGLHAFLYPLRDAKRRFNYFSKLAGFVDEFHELDVGILASLQLNDPPSRKKIHRAIEAIRLEKQFDGIQTGRTYKMDTVLDHLDRGGVALARWNVGKHTVRDEEVVLEEQTGTLWKMPVTVPAGMFESYWGFHQSTQSLLFSDPLRLFKLMVSNPIEIPSYSNYIEGHTMFVFGKIPTGPLKDYLLILDSYAPHPRLLAPKYYRKHRPEALLLNPGPREPLRPEDFGFTAQDWDSVERAVVRSAERYGLPKSYTQETFSN